MSVKTKNIKKVILAAALVSGASGLALMNVGTSYAAESYISGSKNSTQTWVDSTESLGWQYDVVDSDSTKCIIKPSTNDMKTGDVVIPSTIDGYTVVAVMNGAFENCTGLTSVTLPDTCTELGGSAFAGCTGLTSIQGLENINYVGAKALKDCSSLTGKLTLGNLAVLDYGAFENCTGLTEIEIGNIENVYIQNLWTSGALSGYYVGVNHSPFTGCDNMKKLTLGDVENVSSAARGLSTSSRYYEINDDSLFYGLTGLEELHLGKYNKISESNISKCDNLKVLEIKELNKLEYKFTAKSSSRFEDYTQYSSVLPASLEYFKCDSLSDGGTGAFRGLANLKTVDLTMNNAGIEAYEFMNCTALKNVNLKGATYIEDRAFSNTGITSIELNDLDHIGDRAFESCSNLETFKAGNVKTIYGTISSNYGNITYQSIFKNCDKLKSIEFGNIDTIQAGAMAKVGSALTTVRVGNVENVYSKAFAYNENLEFFTSGDITDLATDAFEGTKVGQMVTVTLNYNGQSKNKTVSKGTKASDLGKVTVEDKVFCGWYTDEACEHPFVNSITEDMTLYAGLADDVYFTNQNRDRVEIGSRTPEVGDTLTLNIDGKPAGDVTYSWKWLKPWYGTVPSAPNYIDINETSNSFTITEAYKGRNISVWAQMNGYYITTYNYVIVDGVADDNNGPKIEITSSGISATGYGVGDTLTFVTEPEDATGDYQWLISDTEDGEYTDIEGATDKSYTITDSDMNKYIKCKFTGNGLYRDQEIESESSLIYGTAQNINTSLSVNRESDNYSINNLTPVVGDVLVATTADENEGHVTYQWYRATSRQYENTSWSDNGDELISGATDKEYTVGKDDLGKFVYVIMTGKENKGYTGTVSSNSNRYATQASSTSLTNVLNKDTNKYIQYGDNYVGNTLEIVLPDNINEEDVDIRWFRDTVDSSEKVVIDSADDYNNFDKNNITDTSEQISGANSMSYTLSIEDAGKYVYAIVTDKADSDIVYRSKSDLSKYTVIAQINSLSVKGRAQVGETLSVTTDIGDVEFESYQWYRNYRQNAGGTKIDGATSSTYKVTSDDIGYYISCKASTPVSPYSGDGFTEATEQVTEKTYIQITKAGLTGTAKVGKTLTLNTVPADATGTIEWWTSEDGETWMNILDANDRTYTLTEDEEGKYIKATITGTGDYTGTAEAVTPFKVSGVYSTISNPKMNMTENVGETMRFTYEPADATLEFKWQRSQDGSTWTDIEGETSNEYTVKSEDQGYMIRMTVQGTGDYKNFKYTSPTATIKEDVTSIDLEVTGTKQVGKVLRAKITPEDVEVKYSWLIGDSKDGDFTEVSTSSSYKLTESDGGKFIKLKVTGVSDPTLVAESEPAKVRRIIKSLVITGIPKVGKTLTAVIDPAEATGNFQWEISDENGVFSPIDGEDSADYTIKKSDAGHWIKVTWTGTGDWEGMKVTLQSGGGKTNSSTTIPGKNGTIASEDWKDEDVKVDWTTKVEGGTVSDSTTTLPDNSTTTKGDVTPSESGNMSTAKPGDVITFPKPNVPEGATNGHYEWKYKDDDPDSPTFGEWVLIDGEYGEDLTINEELKNKVIRRDYIFEDEDGNTTTISNAVYIQDEDEEEPKTNPGERIPTSKEKVDYTVIGTDEVYNGYKQGVKVYVSQGQDIAVQLPFKTVLDGRRGVDNKADFHVQVRANIAGDDNIKVIPETEFTLSTNGKADISGEVTVDQTEFNIAQDGEQELSTGKIIDGRVEAFGVSAGHWEGGFSWTISVEGLKINDSTESTEDTTIDTFAVNDKQFKNVMKSVRIATSSNAVAE